MQKELFFVLGADNVSTDISVMTFTTHEAAYKYLKEAYTDVLDNYDDENVEYKDITASGANIMRCNGDFFYWTLTSQTVSV